ncbi:hypothetical protein Fcan01_25419 [Folsomia candida]|uniref:Uncharacterized protein n=1 Tax=Folsomia candida TaxID=158441 RepID=A0A226D4L0_FOLCA|nr:hypothetical protein Fcan01_25419 [Folsomia candida]
MPKKLLTDDLLPKYSLKGMKKKLSLSTPADIKDVLYRGAANLMSPLLPDLAKFEDGISKELTKARDRMYKRNKISIRNQHEVLQESQRIRTEFGVKIRDESSRNLYDSADISHRFLLDFCTNRQEIDPE